MHKRRTPHCKVVLTEHDKAYARMKTVNNPAGEASQTRCDRCGAAEMQLHGSLVVACMVCGDLFYGFGVLTPEVSGFEEEAP